MRNSIPPNSMMRSASNRSITMPVSIDRFHGRSIELLSPFRNHHHGKQIKQSPERLWNRKTQVHPSQTDSNRTDHDAAYLFHTNKPSHSTTSDKKQRPKFDTHKSLTTNASSSNLPRNVCRSTPCITSYRHSSLPTLIPTRIVKRPPKTSDNPSKQSDIDHFNA